ncbi:DUF4145 domain-containing protein [Gracilibacillus oryzae]|uniref:DUF4145 domain-containing protein n=1 Tax=Gracilibacillus oryzae TaxID=1672701 RepID=A0A7C8KN90_9BACI|nr:DUF4145 domain-containing protein [Gracilibacillus oryzae]KAB8127465.1 DUF4145 domain-containing protein [Gracilibacillus oryzae]
MKQQTYFYYFLEDISYELAQIARELEYSVFTSPRTMLTHARVFIEGVIEHVFRLENIPEYEKKGLHDRILYLNDQDLMMKEQSDAINNIRLLGNDAAHQTRSFRFSEALSAWESLYIVIKWYVETYGSATIEVPVYRDPAIEQADGYDIQELHARLKELENKLIDQINQVKSSDEPKKKPKPRTAPIPGETIIRTITYKNEQIEIPYFLRDAFLLPQRFQNAERFMIALGGAQQARIMSELPAKMEGMSKLVKRYKEENEAWLFKDLIQFVEEERIRRHVIHQHPGELFLFFRSEYIIMTEALANIPLTEDNFKGFPNFLRQMQEDNIIKIGQLPQELLILAKYDRVGVGTVEKFFKQLEAHSVSG